MAKNKKNRSGKVAVAAKRNQNEKSSIDYKCIDCGYEEKVPMNVIKILEVFDDDSPEAPEFRCTECGGTMESIQEEKVPTSGVVIHKEFDEKELAGDWLF